MIPVWEQVTEHTNTFELKYWPANSQKVWVSAIQGHGGGISDRFSVYFLCNHRGNHFAYYRPSPVLAGCWLNYCSLGNAAGLMINRLQPPSSALCLSCKWHSFRDVSVTTEKWEAVNKKGVTKRFLPLTGRLESVGRRQLQLASYQSLEHWEQILSQLPDDWEKNRESREN